MSDIWSNVGSDAGPLGDEWLYRMGGEIRGPVPIDALVARLASGELDVMTPVAREGGEFHPVAHVKAFESHLAEIQRKIRKRASQKVRNIVIVLLLLLGASGAGAGYWLMQRAERVRGEQAIAQKEADDKVAAKRAKLDAELKGMGKSELVALVSLGDIKDMKVGGRTSRSNGRKSRKDRKAGSAAPSASSSSDQMVSSCVRSQRDIFGVLGRHIAKINVCVQDEKGRNASGLPSSLTLDFVVKPEGRVVEFDIDHRHFRTGPMKNCMVKVFRTIRFPSVGGTTCPVSIPIKIGG